MLIDQVKQSDHTKGGHNKETIMLTIHTRVLNDKNILLFIIIERTSLIIINTLLSCEYPIIIWSYSRVRTPPGSTLYFTPFYP
jgi:hypothetical protein